MTESTESEKKEFAVERSLDLLWGVEPARRRGRRPRATSADIVRTAITAADIGGLAAISMRKIAEELGVTAMAIYSHVPSKSVLVDVMLDHVLAEARPGEDRSAAGWREGLRQSALRTRGMYLQHPWTLEIPATRRPFGPNLLASMEAELKIVSDLGLPPADMARIVGTIDHYVHGATAADLEIAQETRDSELSDADWFAVHGTMLSRYTTFEDYPTLLTLWGSGALTTPSHDFDFGLERVLDGIEDYIENRPGRRHSEHGDGGVSGVG